MHVPQSCSKNVSPCHFLSLADKYPDFVTRLHKQAMLLGGFGLNGSVPWRLLCFICMEDIQNGDPFLFDSPSLKRILYGSDLLSGTKMGPHMKVIPYETVSFQFRTGPVLKQWICTIVDPILNGSKHSRVNVALE